MYFFIIIYMKYKNDINVLSIKYIVLYLVNTYV